METGKQLVPFVVTSGTRQRGHCWSTVLHLYRYQVPVSARLSQDPSGVFKPDGRGSCLWSFASLETLQRQEAMDAGHTVGWTRGCGDGEFGPRGNAPQIGRGIPYHRYISV